MALEWHVAAAICIGSRSFVKAIQTGSTNTSELWRMIDKRTGMTILLWTPCRHRAAGVHANHLVIAEQRRSTQRHIHVRLNARPPPRGAMPFSSPAYELVTHLAPQGFRYFATVIAVVVYTYLMDDD